MSKEDEIVDLYDPIKNISKISSIIYSVENVKRMISFFKPTGKRSGGNDNNSPTTDSANTVPNDISVNYTGLHTDIAFVSTAKDGIERTSIESIDDNILKRNVLESFEDAVSDGYLTCENGKYMLTDMGKEHINSPAFIKQFEKDQKYNLTNNEHRAVFEFKGEAQDVDIFRYTNSFDLNKLNVSENIVAVDKVNSYFKKLEKTGFVNIDNNRVVTPTEKTLKYLSQHPTKNFGVKPITANNINEVVNTVASLAKSPNTVASLAKSSNTVGVIVEVSKVVFNKLLQKQSQTISQANSRH